MGTGTVHKPKRTVAKTSEAERLLDELTEAAEAKLAEMTPEERKRATAELRKIATKVRESAETRE